MIAQRNEKKQIETLIFPRLHQLDATRKLVRTLLAEGQGGKSLIQHSAGSGKTNTIAWTAHFLADLHNAEHEKLFDTMLVVSDRNVLDTQLRKAIFSFERTTGVVASITSKHESKAAIWPKHSPRARRSSYVPSRHLTRSSPIHGNSLLLKANDLL